MKRENERIKIQLDEIENKKKREMFDIKRKLEE